MGASEAIEGTIAKLLDLVAQLRRDQESGTEGSGNYGDYALGAERGNPRNGDLLRQARPPLPDARVIEQILRMRRLRERYFEPQLFADPAWDILLELSAARSQHRQVCVTSLCVAAAVPSTTALRWIQVLVERGFLIRTDDSQDRRRSYIALSDDAARAMASYFDEVGSAARTLV